MDRFPLRRGLTEQEVLASAELTPRFARRFRLGAQAQTIEIGGHGLSGSKKWRDLQANSNVAFAVDDLASVDPWTPRGMEIRGRAELHQDGGQERFGGGGWDSVWFSIVPQRVISWGIEGPAFSETGHSARSVADR